MSKKSTKALASAALMSLVLTTALSAGPVKAAQGKVTRVSGADRYATASQVATANWESGSDSVVLVSGEGYADAVSASALAKKLGAPILLTEPGSLNADAQKALDTLKPKNVYVIGGNASISQSIRDGLKDKYTLTELGGANRYETNAAVADELVKLGVDASNVLVVGGEGFSDALSVAPVAAAKGQILLLATNDQAKTQPVIDFVKKNNSKVTVVGTKNIINDTIYNALGASSRVDGGADRFATNIKVLNNFQGDLKSDKVYIANASKATPDNLYADALVASAVAGKYSAPLVLVDKDPSGSTTNPNATDNAIAYLKDNTTSSTDFQVIGGTGVVSQAVEDGINAIYNNTNPDQATEVQSIDTVGLNQIKVTFNGEVDEDTAEDLSNYKVDGTKLSDYTDGSAYASLQDDNKTVLITFAEQRKQYDNVDVTVNKGILSADKSETIPEFTQSVTFSDTVVPTLASVTAQGNNKITVKFSEPVNVGPVDSSTIDDGDAKIINNSTFLSKFKIDGQNITNFGLDPDLTLAKNTVSDGTSGYDGLADEVQFYFNSSLQAGNKTLKISDGDQNGPLSDAAGFTFQETSQDFNIDTLSTEPQITSVTGDDSGKVYINFDRPMDTKTAQEKDYYVVNDSNSTVTDASLKNNDTQVKLKVSGLNKGSNKVYIKNNVKDAYGNKVADDTYKSFDLTEDTTKPAVTSVSALDDTTIRVRFNKDVDVNYATSTSNYKLMDNSGTDITYDTSKGIADITVPGGSTSTASVFDIHVKDKLVDSQYTITIKHIQDTASTPNVMDDYTTTFEGSDSVAPVADDNAIALKNDNDTVNPYRKVVVSFNKTMDASSLTNTDNYKFKNDSGDTKALPSGTTISTSSDNKSAIIEFPTAYGTSGKTGDNLVTDIAVIGVKDTNGNGLDVSQVLPITTASGTITNVKQNSIKVYYDGDNLKVNIGFDKSIDNLVYGDFTLNGVVPDSGYKNSDGTITLVYNDGSVIPTGSPNAGQKKIDVVKSAGINAKLNIAASSSTHDVYGLSLVPVADSNNVIPYYYQAAPKTFVGTKSTVNGVTYVSDWTADADTKTVTVKFDTPIEPSSVKPGDFTFVVGGSTLNAKTATVGTGANANTVVFKFDSSNNTTTDLNKFAADATIKVTPITSSKISTLEDKNDSYAYYAPSNDDLKGYTVTITGTTPDTTAPTLSVTSATDPTTTGATLNFTSDEAGTYYYVVYAEGDTAPDKATVVAQGTALAEGTGTASAAANTASVTGLTSGTNYKAYVVVKDAAGNISDVSEIDITTL